MTAITHHTPDALLAAYAVGSLPQPFALVVATHISLCLECRAGFEAHQAAGGVHLEAAMEQPISANLKASVLDLLDAAIAPKPTFQRMGVFPGPVMQALKGKPPSWKSLGMGVRQNILSAGRLGSVRLLYIPPGQAVPDHSHGGLELTLEVRAYLIPRAPRSHHGVIALADALDTASLARRRAVTIPLAREVLGPIDAHAEGG